MAGVPRGFNQYWVDGFAASLDDPSLMSRKASTWWTNGARGIRHGNYNCRYGRSATSMLVMSVQEALSLPNLVCENCYQHGVEALVGVTTWSTLTNLEEHIRVLSSRLSSTMGLQYVQTSRVSLQQAVDLAVDAEITAPGSLVRKKARAALARAARLDKRAARALAGGAVDVNRTAALAVIAKGTPGSTFRWLADEAAAQWMPAGDLAVLDGAASPRRRDGAAAIRMFDHWVEVSAPDYRMAGGRTVRSELLASISDASLGDVAQMTGVPLLAPRPGETLDQLAARCWAKARDRVVDDAIVRWNAQLDSLCNPADLTLVAVRSRASRENPTGTLFEVVRDVFTIATSSDEAVMVLRVPAGVAAWLESAVDDPHSRARITYAHFAGTDADDVAAETALGLWDPSGKLDGPYTQFADALNAAHALLAR
jgi:hypothetical protein